jgi:hypothetical protein
LWRALGTLPAAASGGEAEGLAVLNEDENAWEVLVVYDGAPGGAQRLFRMLTHVAQVKGSFYHPEGRRVAAAVMAERIIAGEVNGCGAYVDPPPRILRARALGIPVDSEESEPAAARWGTARPGAGEPKPAQLSGPVGLAV